MLFGYRVEMMDDQDIVRVICHPVDGLGGYPAGTLQVGDGFIDLAPGVIICNPVEDEGNSHSSYALRS